MRVEINSNGGAMGKTAFSVLVVLFGAFCWAAPPANEYSVDVHVSSSYWEMDPASLGPQAVQRLKAVIGGKKYELKAPIKGGEPSGWSNVIDTRRLYGEAGPRCAQDWVRVLSSLRVSIPRQENEKIHSGRAERVTITI